MGLARKFYILLLLCMLNVDSPHASSPPQLSERPVIRLGIMAFRIDGSDTTLVKSEDRLIRELPSYLQERLPNFKIESKVYRTAQLIEAVKRKEVDVFFASSGAFASMIPDGVMGLATLVTKIAPDPNHAVAGSIIVRKDRRDLNWIKDLNGLRAISGLDSMFFNYQLPMSAVAAEGFDPDKFFSSVTKVDTPVYKVLQALEIGTHDVGLIRACMLEELGEKYLKAFKVISPVKNSPLKCLHTSELYPNWTVGVAPGVDSEVAKKVAGVLLTAPPYGPEEISWSVANNFNRIDRIYKDLKLGPYEFLRHWSLMRFFEAYKPAIFALLAGFFVFVYHFLRVKGLVAKRTVKLRKRMEENRKLQKSISEVNKKYEAAQHSGTLGMLSNMVAHEIRQPLATISYLNHTLERVLEKESINHPILKKVTLGIRKQTEKIDGIVKEVRCYSKSGASRTEVFEVKPFLEKVVEEIRLTEKFNAKVSLSVSEPSLRIKGSKLELEAVFFNLLRNSNEAMEHVLSPEIAVFAEKLDHCLSLRIEDSGPVITESEIERFATEKLVQSTKKDGLGIGIKIVKAIIERHGGTLGFAPRHPSGLIVTIRIPVDEEELHDC